MVNLDCFIDSGQTGLYFEAQYCSLQTQMRMLNSQVGPGACSNIYKKRLFGCVEACYKDKTIMRLS